MKYSAAWKSFITVRAYEMAQADRPGQEILLSDLDFDEAQRIVRDLFAVMSVFGPGITFKVYRRRDR
jgi:hypothetical protein